jgi:hypothetical protein
MRLQTDRHNTECAIIETAGFCLEELRKSTETLGLVLQSKRQTERVLLICVLTNADRALAAVRRSVWNAVVSSVFLF